MLRSLISEQKSLLVHVLPALGNRAVHPKRYKCIFYIYGRIGHKLIFNVCHLGTFNSLFPYNNVYNMLNFVCH